MLAPGRLGVYAPGMIIVKDTKRGPTFADVKPGGHFMCKGHVHYRLMVPNEYGDNAFNIAHGKHCQVGDLVPVELLALVPAEAPDPALTTYGELEPGWFAFMSGTATGTPRLLTSQGCIIFANGREFDHTSAPAYAPVRRLTALEAADHIAGPGASVVAHARGEAVRRSAGGFWCVRERDGTDIVCTDDELRDIVQQGAAALSGGAE